MYIKDRNIVPITRNFVFDQSKAAITFLFIVGQRSFNDIALVNNFNNSYYFQSENLEKNMEEILVLLNSLYRDTSLSYQVIDNCMIISKAIYDKDLKYIGSFYAVQNIYLNQTDKFRMKLLENQLLDETSQTKLYYRNYDLKQLVVDTFAAHHCPGN